MTKKKGQDYVKVKKGQKLHERYVDDIYEVVLVNNVPIKWELKKNILRNPDNLMTAPLPVFGRAYNRITRKPYSPTLLTKDIQELYVIVSYMRELVIAASGVKGTIVDDSQMGDMSPAEQFFWKKLGMMHIETVDEHGKPKNSAYNQWKEYDNTLPASIQYIEVMLKSLETLMGEVIGVPPQATGRVTNVDQVGTWEGAIRQASIVTLHQFNEHDIVTEKALNYYINLMLNFNTKKGEINQLINSDLTRDLFNVPFDFEDCWVNVVLENSAKNLRAMDEIKGAVAQRANQFSLSNIIDMIDTNNVKELSRKVKQWEKQAIEMNRQMAEAAAQQDLEKAKEIDANKINLSNQYMKEFKEMESQLKMMELELKNKAFNFNSNALRLALI